MAKQGKVVILGVFVADTAYRAARQPRMGETILGSGFTLGPGGKGSNQAVAAARLGADVSFITRLAGDAFGDMAMRTWTEAGVEPSIVWVKDSYTGAAYIFIDEKTGDNAIIVSPGAAATISVADIDERADLIRSASVFVTQLEQPIAAAERALQLARAGGVRTVLNPAPAATLPEGIFGLCDYLTPNETETEALTGLRVDSIDGARRAADALLAKGVGAAVITLGEAGALFHAPGVSELVSAFNVAPVVETTGAGDAFNGGFATALARGSDPVAAVRFGCAVAGISVTRPGTAPSMPTLAEVEKVLAGG
jgi:ribokinase